MIDQNLQFELHRKMYVKFYFLYFFQISCILLDKQSSNFIHIVCNVNGRPINFKIPAKVLIALAMTTILKNLWTSCYTTMFGDRWLSKLLLQS